VCIIKVMSWPVKLPKRGQYPSRTPNLINGLIVYEYNRILDFPPENSVWLRVRLPILITPSSRC
jgi:hypothetical protein